ncbi:MAG: DUF1501 domain-containing protein, partial [Verrucomicrobiales bacterium]|nr:DUF1501 domain-containing protein [Verrucomicrobiales bacterium]
MNPILENKLLQNRRHFFGAVGKGIGAAALTSLVNGEDSANLSGSLSSFHKPVKAKRIIYLFQSGAPSQQDLFDHKPLLQKHFGEDMRDHFEMTQRITGMTANQSTYPLAGTKFEFKKHGKSGMEISELLPHISSIADEMCLIRSMHTEAINHDPAVTFFQTGHQLAGRPSMGSWLSYGLGSANDNLPTFVSMVSRGTGRPNCQPLYDRLWGSGFLPTQHAGVKFMGVGDPVLYLNNPSGFPTSARRRMLDDLAKLNQQSLEESGDPEINTRIQQYEMAYRMQTSVPELTDFSDEPDHVKEMYGPDVEKRGSYAYNCLLARRMAERDVRFIQLYHRGWDHHGGIKDKFPDTAKLVDQGAAALIRDLKQRGMLEDTLI